MMGMYISSVPYYAVMVSIVHHIETEDYVTSCNKPEQNYEFVVVGHCLLCHFLKKDHGIKLGGIA